MSTAFIILLILFLSLILFLLFVPIYLHIDTERDIYRAGIGRVVKGAVYSINGELRLQLSILFFKKTIDPFNFKSGTQKREKEIKDPVPPGKKPRSRPDLASILPILKSFNIQKCDADIDTGNYPLNAQLIPLCVAFNEFEGFNTRINFENRNKLQLYIRNNVWQLIAAFIKTKYSSKK